MENETTKYYFDAELWDMPQIVDNNGNIIDTMYVSSNMFSWVVINAKLYSCRDASHYGAIINALMSIHHLDNIEQIEKKFGEDIDDICEEIRYNNLDAEGRFWCKYKIIESTGGVLTDSYVSQLCQQVKVNINDVCVLGRHEDNMPSDFYPIIKYKIIKQQQMIQEGRFDEGEKFKPTVQWMAENYAKANEELFHGALGDCIFKAEPIKSNTRWLGSFAISAKSTECALRANKRTRKMFIVSAYNDEILTYINKDNFFDLCHPTITLSTYYAGTQESLYATLVHEMCHYYTYMNGLCPRQAHGVEFRQIGQLVSYRSNGAFDVKRLADAEVMEGYEADDVIKQKEERRRANKRARANYYLIDNQKDSFMRLVNTNSEKAMASMMRYSRDYKCTMYHITNPEIIEDIYKNGYQSQMRKFMYWSLNKQGLIVKDVMSDSNNYEIIYKP